jgi:hypothetical protein
MQQLNRKQDTSEMQYIGCIGHPSRPLPICLRKINIDNQN